MTPDNDNSMPTIMIVDDTPANVGVLGWYFEENGFRVVVAQDGEEAIERAQYVKPDLILLDVMMPGIDGFETCRRLKMMEGLREIPVIFMTALADTTEKISGFKAGGVDYVTKPCQIEEVLARVNTHLSLRDMQKKLEEQNRVLRQASRERAEAEMRLHLAQFAVDQAPDAILWVTADGSIAYVNDCACRLLRYGRQELLSLHVADIEAGSTRENWPDEWIKLRAKRAYQAPAKLRTRDGDVLFAESQVRYFAMDGQEMAVAYVHTASAHEVQTGNP